eukprot:COSAG01_NODE_8381_length_2806_cov_28.911532_3_plen_95_part_00
MVLRWSVLVDLLESHMLGSEAEPLECPCAACGEEFSQLVAEVCHASRLLSIGEHIATDETSAGKKSERDIPAARERKARHSHPTESLQLRQNFF